MERKTIILVAAGTVVFLGASVGQYFIWDHHFDTTVSGYTTQLGALKKTLDTIGPLTDVYTVKIKTSPGEEILQENIVPKQIPASFINDSYILDPSAIVGKFFKIGIEPGTPITLDTVMEEKIDNSVREMDITGNSWPIGLKVGDYIDFRLTYPLGEDYIVLAHKRVNQINDKTLKVNMTEKEIHLYRAALVDYFLQKKNGSNIYMSKYTEPGVQSAAKVYYSIPSNIVAIVTLDPNVLEKADAAAMAQGRSIISSGLANVTDTAGGAISGGQGEINSKLESGSNAYKQLQKELSDAIRNGTATPEQAAQAEQAKAQQTAPVKQGDNGAPIEGQSDQAKEQSLTEGLTLGQGVR